MRAVLMIALLAVAVPDRPDRNPNDTRPIHEQLDGQWQMISSVDGGKPRDQSVVGGSVYVFTGKRLLTKTLKQPEGVSFEITVDGTKTPATIDFGAGSPPNLVIYPGVFKIEGDILTLCFTRAVNGTRPTEFRSQPDTPTIALFQLRRIGK